MDLIDTPFEIVEEHTRTILRLHGTADNPAEIDSGETDTILTALAEGLDMDLKYTTILGPLDLSPISKRFDRTEDGKLRVVGNVEIWNSELRGPISLCGASFDGNVYFFSTKFMCNTSFSGASFRGNVDFRDSVFYGDRIAGVLVLINDLTFSGNGRVEGMIVEVTSSRLEVVP